MNILPGARTTQIIFNELQDELLIYDLSINKAFCLNKTSAIIYKSCDGLTTFAQLNLKHSFTDDLIFLALDELKGANLLSDNQTYISPFLGMTRRNAIRKVGLATMIALPLIIGLVAPKAANAASTVCPTGFTPPAGGTGGNGLGGFCTCDAAFGIGSSCGRGDPANPLSNCRVSCVCTVTAIIGALHTGTCG